MTDKLRIGIIIGTTRQGRFADKPVAWLADVAGARSDAAFEVVDLRDYDLPFFDSPNSPMRVAGEAPEVKRWAAKLAELDGYLIVTGEYNHSFSGVLKNALDLVYPEVNRKAATFFGYGAVGGARAVEQLRLVLAEMQVATLRHAVHLGLPDYVAVLTGEKRFEELPALAVALGTALDELVWWAGALKTARAAA